MNPEGYGTYTLPTLEDIVRLRRRIRRAGVPEKITDRNLLIATWNIRNLGRFSETYDDPGPGKVKRNLRGLALIAEVVRRFDIVAIQEVKRDTTALRALVSRFLGPHWEVLMSDVSAGAPGNRERLAFVWDRRRVSLTGLAGEIVLPAEPGSAGKTEPVEQFDRTPYMVGFQVGDHRITLLTAHIRFGHRAADRVGELERLAEYTAKQIRDKARLPGSEETNLIVLGDFNIDRRDPDNPLWRAFTKEGIRVRGQLRDIKTTTGRKSKHYDQIAWFPRDLSLGYSPKAGKVDFSNAVFRELATSDVNNRVSDHFPLWVEFLIDQSDDLIANRLGLAADPRGGFGTIPD